jgi:hypothetical protein
MPLVFVTRRQPSWSVAANWNRIVGAAVVNDLLVGLQYNAALATPLDPLGVGELNSQFGIPGAQPIRGLSQIQMGNDITNIGSLETGTRNYNHVYQLNERLTWLRGRHMLKFGGSWNYYQSKSLYPGNNGANGFISYTNFNFTGAAFADFLLDQASRKGRGSESDAWTHLQHRVAAYAADDFKVTNNLTLNSASAGPPRHGRKDDRQAFDSRTPQPPGGRTAGPCRPFYWGGIRPGFAYRRATWVFRGGYGITQYMENSEQRR